MNDKLRKTKNKNIYNKYRKILEKSELTDKEIDEIRHNMKLLAQTICEHVWKRKFY